MINETVNLNTQVTVDIKDSNGNVTGTTVVAYLQATLDAGNQNFNISMSTNNKSLLVASATEVKSQYDAFVSTVKSRATELGYVIF